MPVISIHQSGLSLIKTVTNNGFLIFNQCCVTQVIMLRVLKMY